MLYDPNNRPRPPPRVWPFVLVSTVVLIVTVGLVLLYLDSAGYFGNDHSGRPGGIFYFGFFPIFLVLLLVLFLIRMVFWSRMWGYRNSGYGSARPRRDPAVMTVRQRFARGEITREQYDQLMTDLSRRRYGP